MGQSLGITKKSDLPECAPIIKGVLPDDVRLFLFESLPSDEDSLRSAGFELHADHPTRPGHQYMEGYYHALANSFRTEVDSVHPRFGCPFPRQPAPAPLFAFCEAFRRANSQLVADLRSDLATSRNAATLAEVLESQRHFADLSVQVHWGDEVPPDHVAWHIDAPNSFLHVALSVSGSRALHARHRVVGGRVGQNCLVGHEDEREIFWQEQGDVYMSVPCCFPHAVQYPMCDWDNRVIAVQLRLLLTEEELFGMFGKEHVALDIDPRGGTANIVFRQLAARAEHGLCMPQLADIQQVLAEYQ